MGCIVFIDHIFGNKKKIGIKSILSVYNVVLIAGSFLQSEDTMVDFYWEQKLVGFM